MRTVKKESSLLTSESKQSQLTITYLPREQRMNTKAGSDLEIRFNTLTKFKRQNELLIRNQV